jgi:hypothetical protein
MPIIKSLSCLFAKHPWPMDSPDGYEGREFESLSRLFVIVPPTGRATLLPRRPQSAGGQR